MAEINGSPSSAAAEATPPHDPQLSAFTVNVSNDPAENEDEWEYEYSTTETDTYYVTLDLTTPDVPIKPRQRHTEYTGSRESKTPRWSNPSLGRQKRASAIRLSQQTRSVSRGGKGAGKGKGKGKEKAIALEGPLEEEGEDQVAVMENADDDDDHNAESPRQASSKAATPQSEEGKRAEVQILDLHTENPIISYNGYVYSGRWAQNIGTELLFTRHDPDSTLPVLRNLPHNVDLLAASSARVISSSALLEPKVQQSGQRSSVPSKGKTRNLNIPGIGVGRQATTKRKNQENFLAQLMAIKKVKGEQDKVTVIAQKRQTNSGWKKEVQQMRQRERAKLQKISKLVQPSRQPEVAEAKLRLAEMDLEDDKRRQEDLAKGLGPDGKRTKGNAGGRKRKISTAEDADHPRKRGRGIVRRPRGKNRVALASGSRARNESTSTPTPHRWSDLNGDAEVEQEVSEEGSNGSQKDVDSGNLYDAEELSDDDVPGEDDDTPLPDEGQ